MSIKFKSKLEKKVYELLGPAWKYESKYLEYTVKHKYNPDFGEHPKYKNMFIEVKGRFRTTDEASKYVAVKKCNPEIRLVFIFANPNLRMPNSRRRLDGTFYTHKEWAEKHGFEWKSLRDIEKWRRGKK